MCARSEKSLDTDGNVNENLVPVRCTGELKADATTNIVKEGYGCKK